MQRLLRRACHLAWRASAVLPSTRCGPAWPRDWSAATTPSLPKGSRSMRLKRRAREFKTYVAGLPIDLRHAQWLPLALGRESGDRSLW
jgi:hypothetical protein